MELLIPLRLQDEFHCGVAALCWLRSPQAPPAAAAVTAKQVRAFAAVATTLIIPKLVSISCTIQQR